MKKAIIGIISNVESISKAGYKKLAHVINVDYVDMIIKNGGIPIIIPFENCYEELECNLEMFDGLLLIGGEDIAESCYKTSEVEITKRDEFEIKMYKYFKKNKKPILGICRGLQLINVAEGGSLSNINEEEVKHFIDDDGWINYHEIFIKEHTLLEELIEKKEYVVSSIHHQKIDKLANELLVSAESKDGIIEVIEGEKCNFIMGFQGHIEKCLDNFNKYNNIIKQFIKEAEKNEKR